MRRSTPVRIGELWGGFVETNPVVARKLCEARIPDAWRALIGPGMASLTSGMEIRNGILTVRISSSVARHELFMRREQLCRDINERLGMAVIRSVIIK